MHYWRTRQTNAQFVVNRLQMIPKKINRICKKYKSFFFFIQSLTNYRVLDDTTQVESGWRDIGHVESCENKIRNRRYTIWLNFVTHLTLGSFQMLNVNYCATIHPRQLCGRAEYVTWTRVRETHVRLSVWTKSGRTHAREIFIQAIVRAGIWLEYVVCQVDHEIFVWRRLTLLDYK